MAISATAIAKLAATVASNEKLRKGVGWVIVAILSPLILLLVLLLALLSGTSQHNNAAVDLCFFGGSPPMTAPYEYRDHIKDMQSAFAQIDSAVATVNTMVEGTNGLDGTRIKSVFFTLNFGTDNPQDLDITGFVDEFVRYEERSYTTTNEDGTTTTHYYTVAIPLPIDTVYANIPSITAQHKNGIDGVYTQISSGGSSFSGDILRGNGSSTVIDISGFTDPSTKNSADLVAYAQQAFDNGWGYVWGTCGWILTDGLFQSKLNQYPEGVENYKDFIAENWVGGRTTDCVGLIKGYSWLDVDTLDVGYATNGMPDLGANQMYNVATNKGGIATIPEIPGLAVWNKGHIGVYIGDGYVIEAMGTKYGVVKTKLADRNWTHWLKIPYLSYPETTNELEETT